MPRPRVHKDRNARTKAYMDRLKERDPERVKKYHRENGRRYREHHPEYLQGRAERYRNRRVTAIKQLGGLCLSCGYEYNGTNAAAFDFHHIDPITKGERGLNSLFISGSDMDLWAELEKCDLRCSNCHRISHGGEF